MTAARLSPVDTLVSDARKDWARHSCNQGAGSWEKHHGRDKRPRNGEGTHVCKAGHLAGSQTKSRVVEGLLPKTAAGIPRMDDSASPCGLADGWPAQENLARPQVPGEPAAFQTLRRLPTASAKFALQALAVSARLGQGQPLGPSLRRPLETLIGRDLTRVRLHTAPVAAVLGAEAFTTGRHLVFAPGRLDLHNTRGLALLSHELSHMGQTLAFKRTRRADLTPEDAEERQARQQEDMVQQIIEHGWPAELRMQVRRMTQPPMHNSELDGVKTWPAAKRGPDQGGAAVAESGALPFARLREGKAQSRPGVPAENATPDMDALAHQVYVLLKARLRAERDRHQLYSR